jgi:hypothetical protein
MEGKVVAWFTWYHISCLEVMEHPWKDCQNSLFPDQHLNPELSDYEYTRLKISFARTEGMQKFLSFLVKIFELGNSSENESLLPNVNAKQIRGEC